MGGSCTAFQIDKTAFRKNREILKGIPQTEPDHAKAERTFSDYLAFGSMPAIIDENIEAHEKRDWLRDYIRTYLQRDVRDLANLRESEPFIRDQKALAHLSGEFSTTSQLAKHSGISQQTSKRFVHYLEHSYQ